MTVLVLRVGGRSFRGNEVEAAVSVAARSARVVVLVDSMGVVEVVENNLGPDEVKVVEL